MFCYNYVMSLSEDCGFGAAVACVISSHYETYRANTCACKRRALSQRSMRLMFAAQDY